MGGRCLRFGYKYHGSWHGCPPLPWFHVGFSHNIFFFICLYNFLFHGYFCLKLKNLSKNFFKSGKICKNFCKICCESETICEDEVLQKFADLLNFCFSRKWTNVFLWKPYSSMDATLEGEGGERKVPGKCKAVECRCTEMFLWSCKDWSLVYLRNSGPSIPETRKLI